MGAIQSILKSDLVKIFKDVSPGATPEQKADQLATAIENAILQGLKINVPNSKVVVAVVGQATGTMNPSPIPCEVKS